MPAPLQALENWAAALTARLGPAASLQLARRIALDLRRRNMARMRAQHGPDGAGWEKRKRFRIPLKAIRYVYQKRDGSVRELEMSSYRRGGGRITGYDKVAGGIRTMIGDRVLRKVTPQLGGGSNPASRKKRAQQMMIGLSSARYLKALGLADRSIVEFSGKAQRIAQEHHWGLRGAVNYPRGPLYDYPARALLGLADDDLARIRDLILRQVGGN